MSTEQFSDYDEKIRLFDIPKKKNTILRVTLLRKGDKEWVDVREFVAKPIKTGDNGHTVKGVCNTPEIWKQIFDGMAGVLEQAQEPEPAEAPQEPEKGGKGKRDNKAAAA